MKKLEILPTSLTPMILLDHQENQFMLKGRSLPSNAKDFFVPVLKWFTDYSTVISNPFQLVIELDYFNTSTHKYLDDILRIVREYPVQVNVVWRYLVDDEDLYEVGERLAFNLKIPFVFETIDKSNS